MCTSLKDTVPSLFRCNSNRLYRILKSMSKRAIYLYCDWLDRINQQGNDPENNFHNFLRLQSYGFIFRGITVTGASKGIGILNEFSR
jgi:hypothetical protein